MQKIWNNKTIDLTIQAERLGKVTVDNPADCVVITGYSELTPLGNTRETEEAELQGKSGTKKLDVGNFRTNIAAPIDFRPEDHFSEKELRSMSRIGAMGVVLAREAGQMAGVVDANGKLLQSLNAGRAGCTVSSGIGATTNTVDIYQKIHYKKNPDTDKMEEIDPVDGSRSLSPFTGLQLFPEEPGGEIESALGLQGWSINSAEACCTGLASVADAYQLIRTGKNDIMFAGGVEDALFNHPEIAIGIFASMRGPLSSRNTEPEKASRPFDKDRDGFVLGAGGGVVVLERLDSALARKAPIYAVILAAEKGSDGGNPTNLDTERVARLILKTVTRPDSQNLSYPVDSIFAHATSTKSGDVAEILSLKLALGEKNLNKIPITAIKSIHGHLAGAAGIVNTITAVRTLHKNFMPPIINLDNPDEPFKDLNLVRGKALHGDFQTALVLAYGFHGKDAAVLLGKYIE